MPPCQRRPPTGPEDAVEVGVGQDARRDRGGRGARRTPRSAGSARCRTAASRPCSFPQCGRPPTSPAIDSSAANQGPGSLPRRNVRRRCRRCPGPTPSTAGCRRRRRRAPRPGTPSRQSLASCTRRSSAQHGRRASARGIAYSISRKRTRRRLTKTRCEWSVQVRAPSALADIRASGGTRAGTRRPAATTPAKAALARISSSHTARQRGSGREPLLQRDAGVALQQRHVGVREPVELDVVGRRHQLVEAARAPRSSVPGPSTARSANAGSACRVTAVTTPSAPSPTRAAANSSGCRSASQVEHRAGRRHQLEAADLRRQPAEPRARCRACRSRARRRCVCRSMSPRLVSDQPRRDELGVEPVQRRSRRRTVTRPSSLTRPDPGEPAQASWTSSGRPMPVKECPLPIGRTRRPGRRGGGERRRRPRRPSAGLHDRRRRRAGCRPSCATARGSSGSAGASVTRTLPPVGSGRTLLPGGTAHGQPVDQPVSRPARCAVMSAPRTRRRADAAAPAGPRDRGPRPAVRRPRPRRARRQRRRPGPAGGGQADPGGQQVGALPRRCCAGCSPGRASPASSPTPCPRRCGSPAATTRSATTSSSATRPPTARRCGASPADDARRGARHAHGRLRRAARPDRRRRRRPAGDRRCGSASTSTPRCGPPADGCTSASAARRCTPPTTPPRSPGRWPRGRASALVGLMAYEAQIAGVQDAPARRPLRGARRPRDAGGVGRASWPDAGPRSSPRSRPSPRWSSSTAAAPAASSARRPRTPSPRSPPARGCTAPRSSTGTGAFAARPADVLRRPGHAPAPHRAR